MSRWRRSSGFERAPPQSSGDSEGVLVAQSPAGVRDADVPVFGEGGLGRRVQVKTRTYGADGGWHMREKHEHTRDPGLVYALVDLEPEPPVVYVLPSAVVADALTGSHRAWLETPGRGGRAHRDHVMRRLLPEYSFAVPGFEGRWLERSRDRWDLLTSGLPDVANAPRRSPGRSEPRNLVAARHRAGIPLSLRGAASGVLGAVRLCAASCSAAVRISRA